MERRDFLFYFIFIFYVGVGGGGRVNGGVEERGIYLGGEGLGVWEKEEFWVGEGGGLVAWVWDGGGRGEGR